MHGHLMVWVYVGALPCGLLVGAARRGACTLLACAEGLTYRDVSRLARPPMLTPQEIDAIRAAYGVEPLDQVDGPDAWPQGRALTAGDVPVQLRPDPAAAPRMFG